MWKCTWPIKMILILILILTHVDRGQCIFCLKALAYISQNPKQSDSPAYASDFSWKDILSCRMHCNTATKIWSFWSRQLIILFNELHGSQFINCNNSTFESVERKRKLKSLRRSGLGSGTYVHLKSLLGVEPTT